MLVHFRVRLLRYRGQRLPWREVGNGASYVGDLLTQEVTRKGRRHTVAVLCKNDCLATHLLPDLYEPVLTGMSPLAFALRGFECVELADGKFCGMVQEWYVEIP